MRLPSFPMARSNAATPTTTCSVGATRSSEEATARGRLYDLPAGYPALVVPKEDIRAVGTADPIHDASEKQRLGRTGAHRPDGALVFGKLFTFDDPEERLPALDRLEGFNPGRPCLY